MCETRWIIRDLLASTGNTCARRPASRRLRFSSDADAAVEPQEAAGDDEARELRGHGHEAADAPAVGSRRRAGRAREEGAEGAEALVADRQAHVGHRRVGAREEGARAIETDALQERVRGHLEGAVEEAKEM